ncbi:AraC family transcriptional regulator [Parapedobacter sp. SGR-10]|uniref:helix-turn-helix domain-containing protein n=1 Tax=Parapedobacter sp. SGR-10 TaxID=2710879 RepID=UPI0013D6F30F|nr:helix-turn-helix domain-containing protein [Parapedobacter sp. SGR-10]NGF55531.1 AraC family transcriptional regulator [Parapedobacter sp. SGR-10]
MNHACYLPSPTLSEYVAWYLLSEDTDTHANWQESTVLPNGLSALVFSYGASFKCVTGLQKQRTIRSVSILGPHTKPCRNWWKEPTFTFIIVFKPLGLFKLLGGNLNELKNDVIDLADYGFSDSSWMCEKLAQLTSAHAKIAWVEHWLRVHLAGSTYRPSLTADFLQYVIDRLGKVCVESIVQNMNVNRRYLERQFNLQLGMSPKDYAETIRFSYIASKLAKTQQAQWPELTYLGDFYDQSHFIKHFRKHSNISPGQFRKIITQSKKIRFLSQMNIYNDSEIDRRNNYIVIAEKTDNPANKCRTFTMGCPRVSATLDTMEI